MDSYTCHANILMAYFKEKDITLSNLDVTDIIAFETFQRNLHKSENTIKKYRNTLGQMISLALIEGRIKENPIDRLPSLHIKPYLADYFTLEEAQTFLKCIKGDFMETLFWIAAYYGMRRSEIVGLKWKALTFDSADPRITVSHVVIRQKDSNGQQVFVGRNRAKNQSSLRSLPLIPEIAEQLKEMKRTRKELKRLLGSAYPIEYEDYVFVDEIGDLIKPDRVSAHFKRILKKNGMKVIIFHDLRHSCSYLQLASGIEMHDLQKWLGHSNYHTTSKTYGHIALTESTKRSSDTLRNVLLVDRI